MTARHGLGVVHWRCVRSRPRRSAVRSTRLGKWGHDHPHRSQEDQEVAPEHLRQVSEASAPAQAGGGSPVMETTFRELGWAPGRAVLSTNSGTVINLHRDMNQLFVNT